METLEQKYQRFCKQADEKGVDVTFRFVSPKTGKASGYFVNSSNRNKTYAVRLRSVEGKVVMTCDCEAGEHGTYCMHRAVCRRLEIKIAHESEVVAVIAEAESALSEDRDSLPHAPRDMGAHLYR